MMMLRKYYYLTRFLLVKENYKCFIGHFYNDNKVKPWHIMLPKTSVYVKCYDGETKWLFFLIEDDDLWEKFNTIWDKVSADVKKKFDSDPAYNKSFLRTKIKSHGDEIKDFSDKNIPKVYSNHTCSAVISLDFALKKDGKYCRQVFLKQCQYIEKKVIMYINDKLSNFSSDDDDDDDEPNEK